MKNIAVLILAAGKSSRMDSIKQLEKIGNETLLNIVLKKTKSVFSDTVYCVLGANSKLIKTQIKTKNIQFIENTNFEEGLSSSIVTGIKFLNTKNLNLDGILILLADQPAIEIAYLQDLYTLFNKKSNNIIASKYDDKFGVPAIFPQKYFSDLLLIKGDKGAKEFINQRKNEIIHPKTTTNLIDLDTKEDLNHFKKSILK
ncbi:NTP transferase domain-containing protein [Polaribacter sp. Asnod1-A03]|uniref:nucleotidyltransferase family protein n=1 Tax=Polaribacter sp. Asnod1-A03 TaxID=3160581 RepID=UPI00386D2293